MHGGKENRKRKQFLQKKKKKANEIEPTFTAKLVTIKAAPKSKARSVLMSRLYATKRPKKDRGREPQSMLPNKDEVSSFATENGKERFETRQARWPRRDQHQTCVALVHVVPLHVLQTFVGLDLEWKDEVTPLSFV